MDTITDDVEEVFDTRPDFSSEMPAPDKSSPIGSRIVHQPVTSFEGYEVAHPSIFY